MTYGSYMIDSSESNLIKLEFLSPRCGLKYSLLDVDLEDLLAALSAEEVGSLSR